MICAGPASPGWPGWALRRMLRTKFLITRPERFQGLRPCTNATSFFRSAGQALDLWGAHIGELLKGKSQGRRIELKIVA